MASDLTPDRWAQEIGLFGCPWHGKVAAHKLALPNSEEMDYTQPSELSVREDAHFPACWYYDAAAAGTNHLIVVPDLPAITRTEAQQTADAAAGRQWLTRAVLSGGRFQLYGKDLKGWIYVDPNKDCWLVECDRFWPYPKLESAGAINATVRLTRFGVIDLSNPAPDPEQYEYDVTLAAGWLTGPVGYEAIYLQIDALSRTGNKAAIGLHVGTNSPYGREVEVGGYLEVSISGAGSDATVTLSVLKTYDDCYSPGETSDTTDTDPVTTVYTSTWDFSSLHALWYDDSGDVVEVRLVSTGSSEHTVVWESAESRYARSHSETSETAGALICGADVVEEFSGSMEGSGTWNPTTLKIDSTGTLMWNGEEFQTAFDEAPVWATPVSSGGVGKKGGYLNHGVMIRLAAIPHCLHAVSLVTSFLENIGGYWQVYSASGGPAATPSGAIGETVALEVEVHEHRRRDFYWPMNPRPQGFYYGAYDWLTGAVTLWQDAPVCYV